MIHFIFTKQDKRYLFLKFDTKEDELWLASCRNSKEKHINLTDHINLVDPVCYLRQYKGPPKTQDFLYRYVQPTGQTVYYCSIGLWQEVYLFFKENNIKYDGLVENKDMFKRKLGHTFEQFKAIVDSWGMSRTPRPYQYESAYKILCWNQSVSELATRAGKTLIAYMIFRYCAEYLGAKRMLMIVPSIDLVTQGYNDFKEYKEFFRTECIWSGGELVESANLSIGTFQSLIKFLDRKSKKYNPHFFDGYDIVFCDETHRATADQMKTIISQPFMKDVKISFGMTGTIPEKNTIPYFCLKTLLGATIQVIKPIELMNGGYISPVSIQQIRLHYKNTAKQISTYIKCAEYGLSSFDEENDPKHPGKKKRIDLANPQFQIKHSKTLPNGVEEAKKKIFENGAPIGKNNETKEYINFLKKAVNETTGTNSLVIERMMAHFMNERISYLCNNILPVCDKNTLILAHHTEYIRYFTDVIKKYFPSRHVEMITGAVNTKERNRIKDILKEHNDCILVASYGVMSTGITLSNLCFGVLFESFKSNVVNMQSIGRGLGLSNSSNIQKDCYYLYDIIDVFNPSWFTNKILDQGDAKIEIYKENQYPYKIVDVRI